MAIGDVLPECPAPVHNTASAGRGRSGKPKCVCPGVQKLTEEENRRRRASRGERRKLFPKNDPKPIKSLNYPDFSRGLCTTPYGESVARQAVTDLASAKAIAARDLAKAMCNTGPCPIRDSICRPWVLREEDPPGSWGGVWGGLDPWNRRGWELIIRDGKAELIPYGIDKH